MHGTPGPCGHARRVIVEELAAAFAILNEPSPAIAEPVVAFGEKRSLALTSARSRSVISRRLVPSRSCR